MSTHHEHAAGPVAAVLHGSISGVIGAMTITVWFFIIDALAGQPLATPLALGRGLLGGDLPAWQVLLGYTAIHIGTFVVLGIAAGTVLTIFSRAPSLLFAGVLLFVFLEVAIHLFTAIVAVPLLGSLAWINIAAGNFVAAMVAGGYLWRRFPAIGRTLAHQPLGVPAER
jgi:hypothetical protein